MLRHVFENDAQELREWLGENAILIVDRGYEGVIPLLDELGIEHRIPVVQGGQSRLFTRHANENRIITKNRWIVEARNGHMKSVFKFFRDTIPFHHANNLQSFYLIARAILNRYRNTISMDEANAELAREILARANIDNDLRIRVENE
ncbi:hypothetical protein HHI36_004997 [Cryptolaemus montrouzieri]|uniref:DDE Tnp4 domain-containing protein n=1 Tax=Cryptolaemus montrouzieri TaxID=559131 RepID=A0ABD2NSU6_9CUCU